LQNFSVELFHERAGRLQIRKTPPKIDLAFSNNSPSIPRLNFSRPVKVHHPAAHFDIQFIIYDEKLNDAGILLLVSRPPNVSSRRRRASAQNANIHYQPFPESVSEEHEIYTDYNGCHRHHVKHHT
jgi:hypothetical protein